MNDQQNEFWIRFLRMNNLEETIKPTSVFHFELTEKLASELLELVLGGKKRATASSYSSYKIENKELPLVGDLSIVTDFYGKPKCVIKTTAVLIAHFNELTFDIVKREGEDENLESWQKGHIKFFSEEANILGYEFSRKMLVVFEDFEVVYKE